MDFAELTPKERLVDILDPVKQEPTGIVVSLVSFDDPKLNSIKRKITDDRLRLESRGKTVNAADIENNEYAMIFAAMTGWSWNGDAQFNKTKPEFNLKNVTEVLERLPWMKRQISSAIAEVDAFF